MRAEWDPQQLPDLTRKRVAVTGATRGLGYFTAEQLAGAGAHVVLAARSPERTRTAVESIRSRHPDARLSSVRLDLADLSSVERAATELRQGGPLDALVANAGVVGSSRRRETADGLELQLGTNMMGHFALIAQTLPALDAAPSARIVHLSSISHAFWRLRLDDLQSRRRYSNASAYARSKLAVHLFGTELARRLSESGRRTVSVVAHPGLALDALSPPRPGVVAPSGSRATRVLQSLIAQGKDAGAWPIVRAAIEGGNGEYWGPAGAFQLIGPPVRVSARPWVYDRAVARRLWQESERDTGIEFRL